MIDFLTALESLRPKAQWSTHGKTYSDIVWMDQEQTKPTEEEINIELGRLQAEYEAKEYQRNRAAAYPSIVDQLDTLYHGGYDAWKATITAVKEEFPKP